MANIFSLQPGVTVAIPTPYALPVTFVLGGWGGFPLRRCTVDRIQVSSSGNYQFLSTLRNFIYVYIFGEQPGNIVLSGRAFLVTCAGGLGGISGLTDYYNQYSIARTGAPLGVQLAAMAFYGFLTGITVDVNDAGTYTSGFSLQLKTIPV